MTLISPKATSFLALFFYALSGSAQSVEIIKINRFKLNSHYLFSKSEGKVAYVPAVDDVEGEITYTEILLPGTNKKKHKLSLNRLNGLESLFTDHQHIVLVGPITQNSTTLYGCNIYKKDKKGDYVFIKEVGLNAAKSPIIKQVNDSILVIVDYYYAKNTDYPESNLKLYYINLNTYSLVDTLFTKFSNSSFSSIIPNNYFIVQDCTLILLDPATGYLYNHKIYDDSLTLIEKLFLKDSNTLDSSQLAYLNMSAMVNGVMSTYAQLITYLKKDSLYYFRSIYNLGDSRLVEINNGIKPYFSVDKFILYRNNRSIRMSKDFEKILSTDNYRFYYMQYLDDETFIVRKFTKDDVIYGRNVKKNKCYFIIIPESKLRNSET